MTRSLLFASIFALVLCAVPTQPFAQQNQQQQQQNTSYPSFNDRDDSSRQSTSIWQYSNKYKGGQGHQRELNQYDEGYREYIRTGVRPDITKPRNTRAEGVPVILPTGSQLIYLVRTGDIKSNEAILRILTPVSIDGCVTVVPPTVKLRKGGNMLAYSIQEGAVALDKKTQYGHFQCDNASRAASADIILNRDELMRDGIKAISLQAANGAMDVYDVTLTPDNITLRSRNADATAFKPFTGSAKRDPLSYDFYPDNLLILYAPFAPAGEDISADIATLARRKGLNESTVLKNGPGLYFIDQAGSLAGSLEFGANAFVGTISVPETFHGPNGPYQQAKAVDVYAKRPGMLD